MNPARRLSKTAVAVLVLVGALAAAFVLLKTAPKTEPDDAPKPAARIVQVIDIQPRDERISVIAWGSVVPAREVTMRPQVSGRIVRHHEAAVPGGRLVQREELLAIDRADYELALVERTAELEEARLELEVEKGRQVVAEREWEQLQADLPGSDVNPDLALRRPHLRQAEAMFDKARNAITKAELDLSRTSLTVPFNCMVVEESVEIGQLVSPGDAVCRLVGTDQFWVRATLPIGDVKWVRFPANGQPGSRAEIHLDTGNGRHAIWEGRAVRLLSDLESTGRMARILVEVRDPLGLATGAGAETPLLLESYVRVDIEAGLLEDVLVVPRIALREDSRLWIADASDTLAIRAPEILWTRPKTVLVPNVFEQGDRLIVSELKTALPGMALDPQPLAADNESPVSK